MRKVYICSPYRAKDSAELDRNLKYAQALTRQAIKAGLAPITPHLYMTQCLNEDNPEERAAGLAAGLELLKCCDFVIAGIKYGISEGMSREIQTADKLGIEVVNADKLREKMKHEEKTADDTANDYAKLQCCHFCAGSHLHSCTGYDCREPYEKAYKYAKKRIAEGAAISRSALTMATPCNLEKIEAMLKINVFAL